MLGKLLQPETILVGMHKKRLATGLRLGPQGDFLALPKLPYSWI